MNGKKKLCKYTRNGASAADAPSGRSENALVRRIEDALV